LAQFSGELLTFTVPDTNGVVQGNLRDFRDSRERRMKDSLGTVISFRTLGRRLFSRGSTRSGRWPVTAHVPCCAETAIDSVTPTHAQSNQFVASN